MCFGCSKEPSQGDGFLSTHNICFGLELRKIFFSYSLLSGGLISAVSPEPLHHTYIFSMKMETQTKLRPLDPLGSCAYMFK